MSVQDGRDLHARKHPTPEQRDEQRTNQPQPTRGEKSVAAGKALHDNHGKHAPNYAEGA